MDSLYRSGIEVLEASQKRTVPSSCLETGDNLQRNKKKIKLPYQDVISFKEHSGNKIQVTNFISTYPVSNKSFVKDSAPAIFPPLIGHS